jgi:lysozyme
MDAGLKNSAINLLRKHEGYQSHCYRDSKNLETIGIGRNISTSGPGLRDCEIQFMLENDILDCFTMLVNAFSWMEHLTTDRQVVMIDLCFNLGFKGLLSFEKFLGYMNREDYQNASTELLNSLWAKQVGHRAQEDAKIILTGEI